MGMYTNIGDEEVKFTGLLAKATFASGITVEQASVVIPHGMASTVLSVMIRDMTDGCVLPDGSGIDGQAVHKLRRDADVLALLFDWVVSHKDEDELVFG